MKSLLALLAMILAGTGTYPQDSISQKDYLKVLGRIDSLKRSLDSAVLYGGSANPIYLQQQVQEGYASAPLREKGDRELTILTAFAVLAFGLFLIGLTLIFLIKSNKGFGSLAFKFLGLILVLTISLFLVVIGLDIEKISFLIVLIGIVTGFILGLKITPKG